MFPEITGTALPVLVFGVVLAVVGSEEHLTRIGRQTSTPGLCVLPDPLLHGRYRPSDNRCPPANNSPACLLAPGAIVPNDWPIFFKCDEGYEPNTTNPVTFCKDGRWEPHLPSCKRGVGVVLPVVGSEEDITLIGTQTAKPGLCVLPDQLLNGRYRPSGNRCPPGNNSPACLMAPGAFVPHDWAIFFECDEGYVFNNTQPVTFCKDGRWKPPLPFCKRSKVEEVSTTTPSPSLVSTPELLPKVRKSVQKCQEYAATVNPGTCTMTETSISDQEDVQPHEFPHMAMIGSKTNSKVSWRCGGSLISERFVLGCARCCEKYGPGESTTWYLTSFARLGAHNIISRWHDRGAQDYDIINRIFHPEFDNADSYYAFALYKLKDNVKFNYFIRPICLQTEDTFVNTYAIGTGWWYNYNDKEKNITIRILKKDNLTIVENEECINIYKETLRPDRNFTSSMICAMHVTGYGATGECEDFWYNGGPLQIRQQPNCMYRLVGVLYFGLYRTLKAPWWYMKVSYHVPWIESVVWP